MLKLFKALLSKRLLANGSVAPLCNFSAGISEQILIKISHFYPSLGALAYFLLAKFGMTLFSLTPSNITLLWLPSGIAMVMCLHYGWRAAPWILSASFAANIQGLGGFNDNAALIHTAVSASVDIAAGLISAALFKRYLPDGLSKSKDLVTFVFLVCLCTTAITSTALAVNLNAGGYIQTTQIPEFVRMLILADSLGILLVYPIYQGWQHRGKLCGQTAGTLLSGFVTIAMLLALVILDAPYAIFFILPVLLTLSFKLNLLSLTVINTLSMAGITATTAAGYGPFVSTATTFTDLNLISYLFASALTVLGIALQNHQLSHSEALVKSWQSAANTDALTGILNRRAFFEAAQNEIDHLDIQASGCYSVAFIDLDGFKMINDTYGHGAGDQVLARFAQVLEAQCRDVDIPARIGGEEFAVFLPKCAISFAEKAMERVRATFAQQAFQFEDTQLHATVSIGVASPVGREDKDKLERVMHRADVALYSAKTKRNTVVLST